MAKFTPHVTKSLDEELFERVYAFTGIRPNYLMLQVPEECGPRRGDRPQRRSQQLRSPQVAKGCQKAKAELGYCGGSSGTPWDLFKSERKIERIPHYPADVVK